MSLRRTPSLGAILLLVLLVIALIGGEDEGERGGGGDRPAAEDRRGGGDRESDRGGRGRSDRRDDEGRGGTPPERSGDGGPVDGTSVPFIDVVDGDTIHVRYEGREESVRLIGVDTPEVDPSIGVECFGPDASAFTERLLGGVGSVRIVFDDERRDLYDRLLAYVYVGPEERFVNAALVRRGYAETLTIAPNDRFAALFDRLEQAAANAGRGLWGEC